MTKAEEIANQCAIKEEWFYGPLIKSINEALEWAARQCEEEGVRLVTQRDADSIDGYARTVLNVRASHIRAGKQRTP